MHKLLLAAFATSLLAGCGVVYKVDVYQGNVLRKENVEQLRTGLTKRQVIALLGSPSIADPFHQSRWDYLSTVSKDGADPEIADLVLNFDGDVLASIDGKPLEVDELQLQRDLLKYPNLPRDDKKKRR